MSVINNDHVLRYMYWSGVARFYSYQANANVSDIASVISMVWARTHVPSTALKILQYE